MKAILRGIQRINGKKKSDGTPYSGLTIYLERDPFPYEKASLKDDSVICWSEYIPESALVQKVAAFPIMSSVEIEYIPRGKYVSVCDINLI